jgi:hypothetical protein
MGTYVAEVKGEIQEKVSTFDNSRSYLELLLMLKSDRGEFFSFSWCFTVRSPKLADFLLAIGVRRLPSGNVHPPPKGPYIGQKVYVSIGQQSAKGAKDGRLVNEILSVYKYDEAASEPHVADDGKTTPF